MRLVFYYNPQGLSACIAIYGQHNNNVAAAAPARLKLGQYPQCVCYCVLVLGHSTCVDNIMVGGGWLTAGLRGELNRISYGKYTFYIIVDYIVIVYM